jgi:hypothetical protein
MVIFYEYNIYFEPLELLFLFTDEKPFPKDLQIQIILKLTF